MNAFGVYDYAIWTKSFQSSQMYKEYLAKKSGITMSQGTFAEEQSDYQKTTSKSSGSLGFGTVSWGGSGESTGGSSSTQSGVKSSESLEEQGESQSTSTSNSFLAVLEADIKLYEIALDHSSPSDLSAPFLEDFSNLPTSYYHIGADIKLQEFILRYGTHYVKSATFGGKLDVFKRSSADSTMSQSQFSQTSETEFASMMGTLKSSFAQSESTKRKASIWSRSIEGSKSRSESQEASGEQHENNENTKQSTESGNQMNSRSEFVETTVEVVGGAPEIAAAIMDFYTPAFKERFVDWLNR